MTKKYFKGKKVLIIGGTGTIGQALVNRIIKDIPAVLRVYSRDEYKQYLMSQKLKSFDNIRFLIGDIRDKERLNRAMKDIDFVFNLAAMKHVPSCEYDPFEAIKTNIIGTQNVIECAMENRVKKVIYTSSDKAVSPTNTMGATKLLAERVMTSSYFARGESETVFASVRFGNVMGSRGSVIPLFKEQILEEGKITVTEPEMTRFMMSLNQAVELTVKALQIAKGGEVFVLKMPVVKLIDLAETVVECVCDKNRMKSSDITIEKIGLRPGEKMYEELMAEYESAKAVELEDMYIIEPFYGKYLYEGAMEVPNCSYSSLSRTPISREEVKDILLREGLI